MAEERKVPRREDHGGGPGGGPRGGFQKPKNFGKTMVRMFSYLLKRPVMFFSALICVVVSSLSSVAGTYALRPIINNLTDAFNEGWAMDVIIPKLISGILLLCLVYIIMAVSAYLQSRFMAIVAQKGCNQLRKDLFEHLQDLPLNYFDRHTHGELMSRFTNDADNVQMALEQSVVQLLSSVISFVATLAMMIFLSPLLFLITIAVLIAVMLVFKKLGGASRRFYRNQQAALGAVNGSIQENIEGLKVVKAFTHEDEIVTEFAQLNENYRVAATKANFYSSMIMPINSQLANVGYAITAACGGAMAIFRGFDIGGLVSFLTYSKQIAQPLNQISMQMTTILSAMAGAERIFDVMDAEPELDEGKVTMVPAHWEGDVLCEGAETEGQKHFAWKVPQEDGSFHLVDLRGAVTFNDVCFSYVPEKEILHHINCYAKPGQKIAFVGSTGAGKTTITNLINRFYEIHAGTITYDGVDIKDIQKDSLRRSLGAVLQDTHLFTGTVMDNIRYGRLDATDEECIAAAKAANAHSFIRRLPNGYQTMVTGDGANLSQGQRQLLAIARAAVADPPVLVLDEATSSIDTRTEALISNGMDTLMNGRTVFVIAHRLSTVRNSNVICVIEGGNIMEKGSHHELLDLQGRYYQLYTGQFQLT